MKLDEQILSCARVNGYTGKGTKVVRPKYNSGDELKVINEKIDEFNKLIDKNK